MVETLHWKLNRSAYYRIDGNNTLMAKARYQVAIPTTEEQALCQLFEKLALATSHDFDLFFSEKGIETIYDGKKFRHHLPMEVQVAFMELILQGGCLGFSESTTQGPKSGFHFIHPSSKEIVAWIRQIEEAGGVRLTLKEKESGLLLKYYAYRLPEGQLRITTRRIRKLSSSSGPIGYLYVTICQLCGKVHDCPVRGNCGHCELPTNMPTYHDKEKLAMIDRDNGTFLITSFYEMFTQIQNLTQEVNRLSMLVGDRFAAEMEGYYENTKKYLRDNGLPVLEPKDIVEPSPSEEPEPESSNDS